MRSWLHAIRLMRRIHSTNRTVHSINIECSFLFMIAWPHRSALIQQYAQVAVILRCFIFSFLHLCFQYEFFSSTLLSFLLIVVSIFFGTLPSTLRSHAHHRTSDRSSVRSREKSRRCWCVGLWKRKPSFSLVFFVAVSCCVGTTRTSLFKLRYSWFFLVARLRMIFSGILSLCNF